MNLDIPRNNLEGSESETLPNHISQGSQGITKNRSQNGRDDRGRRDDGGRGGPPGKKVIMGLSIQEKVCMSGAKFEYVYLLPMNVRSKSDVQLDPETIIMK